MSAVEEVPVLYQTIVLVQINGWEQPVMSLHALVGCLILHLPVHPMVNAFPTTLVHAIVDLFLEIVVSTQMDS